VKKITENQIYDAANKFVTNNGRTPTWKELREELGGGSPTTLNRYYRPWREIKDRELAELQTAAESVIEKVPVPESVLVVLNDAWSKAIADLKIESFKEIDALRVMCKAENEQLVATIKERDEIIDILESEAVEREESFEKQLNLKKIELDVVQDKLGEQLVENDYKSREIGKLNGRIAELDKQIARELEATQKERSIADEAKGELERTKAELNMSKKEVARLTKSFDSYKDNKK
jgi:hypothetical protein